MQKLMKTSKTMFIATLAAGSLFALSLALRAADTNKPPANPPPGAPSASTNKPPGGQQYFDQMAKQLDLTDEQKPKFQAIMDGQRKEIRELRQDPAFRTLSPEDRNAKIKAIHNNTVTQMKKLLTPEQFEKWQKTPKLGPGMHGNRPGRPVGGPNARPAGGPNAKPAGAPAETPQK